MDASLYTDILDLQNVFPDGHRFMQDNNPKHTSQATRSYSITQSINWWTTHAESSDLNSIENLWNELKGFIRCEVKPTSKAEVINGIDQFWCTVTDEKCRKYITHLHEVIQLLIE